MHLWVCFCLCFSTLCLLHFVHVPYIMLAPVYWLSQLLPQRWNHWDCGFGWKWCNWPRLHTLGILCWNNQEQSRSSWSWYLSRSLYSQPRKDRRRKLQRLKRKWRGNVYFKSWYHCKKCMFGHKSSEFSISSRMLALIEACMLTLHNISVGWTKETLLKKLARAPRVALTTKMTLVLKVVWDYNPANQILNPLAMVHAMLVGIHAVTMEVQLAMVQ